MTRQLLHYGRAVGPWLVACMLAAVTLPGCCGAFDKYKKRSKIAEAQMNIAMMQRAAIEYFYMEHMPPEGGTEVVEAHFPRPEEDLADTSQDRTWEAVSHTTGIPAGGKAMPDANFDEGVWRAMSVTLYDPTYFRYTFRSGGNGDQAWCEIIAEGDLDGDGISSSFSSRCDVNPDTKEPVCGTIVVENELE